MEIGFRNAEKILYEVLEKMTHKKYYMYTLYAIRVIYAWKSNRA